jgi:cellulose synthase/poly-beta-1,6-N-acetylglucosamine synthase-like glycosyltransferase
VREDSTETVSVIVPTYRRPESLARTLDALSAQTRQPDEVLVVTRLEDSESQQTVERHGANSLRIIFSEAPGQVRAINAGLRKSTGSIVALTDDDAAPREDWIAALLARFASDARIGAVGGRDHVHEHGTTVEGRATIVGRVSGLGRLRGNHHFESELQDVDFLKGANMAFRREALDWFDERLRGLGAEVCNDMQATLGVKRRGYRVIWDPAVVVEHYPAERHDHDARSSKTQAALFDRIHNETYVLASTLCGPRRAAALGFAFLIGSRRAPGLMTSMASRLLARPADAASPRLSLQARVAGVRTALAKRHR